MTWYDNNKVAEWKTIIAQPYRIDQILNHWELIVKDIAIESELCNWINLHCNQIIEDCLKLALQYSKVEDSEERKYLWPTRAIQLMTNDKFLSYLNWNTVLVRKYIHLMLKYFLSTPCSFEFSNNIYHGYFHRLFGMLFTVSMIDKAEIMLAIEQENKSFSVIEKLLQYLDKQMISEVLQFLLVEEFSGQTLSLQTKGLIVDKCLKMVEQWRKDEASEIRIQNIIKMMKIFVIKTNQYIKQIKSIDCILQKRANDYLVLYNKFQSKIHLFINIIVDNSISPSLKIVCLDLVKYYEIFHLISIEKENIPFEIKYHNISRLIEYFSKAQVSIITSYFLDFFKTVINNANHEPILDILIRFNIIKTLFEQLISNPTKNIFCSSVFEFSRVLIALMESELSVGRMRNELKVTLGSVFMNNLRILATNFCSLKSKNSPLFSFYYKLFKLVFNYSRNAIEIHGVNSPMPQVISLVNDCSKWIEFYKSCFVVYEKQIFQDLGRYNSPETISNNEKDIKVTKHNKQVENENHLCSETIPSLSLNKNQIMNSISLEEIRSKQISLKANSTTLIEIPHQEQIKLPQIKSETTLKDSQNNFQELDETYESYLKRKISENNQIISQRKSKSKTPTKMKSENKKAKNRWTQNEQNLNEVHSNIVQKGANILNNISPKLNKSWMEAKIDKISLIRLNQKTKPKKYKERVINEQVDKKLLNWLNLSKSIR